MSSTTIPAAFADAISPDPAQPLLTWYDDGTGERVELSGASLANWLAKTANLLVDGCGLTNGDVALVDLPPHWQTAAVLLGCWGAGLHVVLPPPAPAAGPAPAVGRSVPAADVVFAVADRAADYVGDGAPVYGLALAPMAAPLADPPPGVSDYVTEVRMYGDEFHPVTPVRPEDPAVTWSDGHTVTHEEAGRAGAARAGELGIAPDGRVLVDSLRHPDPRDWWLAPLLVRASVVLCAHLAPDALPNRVAAERISTVLA